MSDKIFKLADKSNGILGELHKQYEDELFKQEKDNYIGMTREDFDQGAYTYNMRAYAKGHVKSRKGKKALSKLQGLYLVLGAIKEYKGVVTADMISKDTYKMCKTKFGLSSKEVERLVADTQEGSVPRFELKKEKVDEENVGLQTHKGTQVFQSPAAEMARYESAMLVFREERARLTAEESPEVQAKLNEMSDEVFAREYNAYHKNKIILPTMPKTDRATLKVQEALYKKVKISVSLTKDTHAGKIATASSLKQKNENRKAGIIALRNYLVRKRQKDYIPANRLIAVEGWHKEALMQQFGLSAKELDQIAVELQTGKFSDEMLQGMIRRQNAEKPK